MKRENLSFLIKGRDIILIKYCILFLALASLITRDFFILSW